MSLSISEINDLRKRVLSGEKPSIDELARAIDYLRGERPIAQEKASTSRTARASKRARDSQSPEEAQAELDRLLGEL